MNVLYTELTYVFSNANIKTISIYIIVVVCLIVTGAFLCNAYNRIIQSIGVIMTIIGIICVLVGLFYFLQEFPGPNNYWVTLNENYSLEELKEEYNILDQKGLLYIVEEKEN